MKEDGWQRRRSRSVRIAAAAWNMSRTRMAPATGTVRSADGVNTFRQGIATDQEGQKGGHVTDKKKPAEMTVEDALRALAGWHHSFVSEEGANRVARALGIEKPVPCYAGRSDRRRRSEGTFDASRSGRKPRHRRMEPGAVDLRPTGRRVREQDGQRVSDTGLCRSPE